MQWCGKILNLLQSAVVTDAAVHTTNQTQHILSDQWSSGMVVDSWSGGQGFDSTLLLSSKNTDILWHVIHDSSFILEVVCDLVENIGCFHYFSNDNFHFTVSFPYIAFIGPWSLVLEQIKTSVSSKHQIIIINHKENTYDKNKQT